MHQFLPQALNINRLTLERGGQCILHHFSMILPSSNALIVTGLNGIGKSSLLRAIAGLLPIKEGEIKLTPSDSTDLAAHIHYLGSTEGLKYTLTVFENITFCYHFLHKKHDPPLNIHQALSQLDLLPLAHIPVASLSQGQKKRVALTRFLINPRPVWILDEPLNGLDAPNCTRLIELMTQHLQANGLILTATHTPINLPNSRHLHLSREIAL